MIIHEKDKAQRDLFIAFCRQGKATFVQWLDATPFKGAIADAFWELFRASLESPDGTWEIRGRASHRAAMDPSLTLAACQMGLLALDLDGQVYPGPLFPEVGR